MARQYHYPCDLGPIFAGLGLTFFNQSPFGSNTKPSAALIVAFPDLAFDSYVGTTTDQTPAVPGKLNGTGVAQVGTDGQFNVSWGATPNTGGTGLLEIARITILGGPIVTTVPINGIVADSLNPNTNIALPPMPSPFIPEPACISFATAGLLALRRR